MKIEEFLDGKLIKSQTLQLDPDISNCLKELEAAGIDVQELGTSNRLYWVNGNAGQVFYLYNDSKGRPRMRIPGEYHNNIADFRHLVLNVYHYQWRTKPVHADPLWRALFLRFGFVREGENGLFYFP